MKKIGFIGMGNMASAIAGGIIKSGFIDGKNVYAFDIDSDKLAKMNSKFDLLIYKQHHVVILNLRHHQPSLQ